MTLSSEDIGRVLDALDSSGWDQAEIIVGDVRIAVGRNDLPAPGQPPPAASGAAPPPPAAPSVPREPARPEPVAAPAAEEPGPGDESAPGDHVLTAPSIGVFWRCPSPGAPPFVEVGSRIGTGDTVGIVEVMKLMNNVLADRSGTVTAVFPENAQHVEFGSPLVAIRADA